MSVKLKTTIQAINKLALTYGSISSLALAVAAPLALAENNQPMMIEEIEVTGIRGSLKTALDNKRNANAVIDSINAEDIGKFPDKNIGDALQRVPGVTVERGFGEVSGVNIRGTAPQHSIILLNGQNVGSVGWFDRAEFNRSFNFEMLSAEQVSGVDVYKSSEAQLNEGAMGGTVNLKTRKPLDLDAFTVFASAEGGYSELSDDWTPSASGLVSWKNDSESFGVLLAHSYEESNVNRETLRSHGIPSVGNGATDSNGNSYATTWGMSSILFDEERERTSTQLTAQFSPTDALQFTVDYMEFGLKNDHMNTAMFALPGNFFGSVIEADSVEVNSEGVITRGDVISGSSGAAGNGVSLFNNTVVRQPEMDSDVLNLTVDYEGDGWSSNIVVGKSDAKSRVMQSSTWWGATSAPRLTDFSFDVSGVTTVTPKNANYVNSHIDQELFQEFTYLQLRRDNSIEYAQADFNIEAELGAVNSFDIGIKHQDQSFESSKQVRDLDIAVHGNKGLTLANFNGGHESGLHSQEGSSSSINRFAIADRSSIWNYAEQYQAANTQVQSAFSVEEEILAAYAKANFEGDAFRGNFGVRIVDTDVYSQGSVDNAPASSKKNYTDVLPSINVAYDLSDDLLLRFAAGSTVSRPDYDDMQMAASIQVNDQTATIGNADLEPYRADQYDIGAEWYFTESSVLGATYFKKNISDYIETTQAYESLAGCGSNCLVQRSRNVGTADVSGVELQYQQDFGNGFGVLANYTYTDSKVNDNAGQSRDMQGVSPNSFNASGYYENEIISARIAYNFRDEWWPSGEPSGVSNQDYQQWDASLIWHLNENIDLSLEAVNIFNETIVSEVKDYDVGYIADEFGARYYVGASVHF